MVTNKNHDTEVIEPKIEEEEEEEESKEDISFDADDAIEEEKTEEKESEESTEEETEEEEESKEEETEIVPKQPKPVEGETTRERGLRKDNERLRRKNREIQEKEMFKKDESTPVEDDAYKKLSEDYSPEELATMEKNFDIIAKKKGLTAQTTDPQDIFEDFMDDNPEYRENSEEGDARFSLFEEKLNSGIYNLKGATRRQMKAVFRDIHDKVKTELGEDETPQSKINIKKRNAEKQKIKSVSHTGGTKIKQEKKPSALDEADDDVKKMFKGDWDI